MNTFPHEMKMCKNQEVIPRLWSWFDVESGEYSYGDLGIKSFKINWSLIWWVALSKEKVVSFDHLKNWAKMFQMFSTIHKCFVHLMQFDMWCYSRKIFLKDIRKWGICMSNVIMFPKSYNGHMKFQHIICFKIENKSSIILWFLSFSCKCCEDIHLIFF